MKKLLTAVALYSCSALASEGALVSIGSERTFAPRGFDDNDQIQIVVEGKLDNDCYRLEAPSVRVDSASRQITVQPQASYYNWLCLEVLVPWTQVINVGRLAAGDWSFKIGSAGESERMTVNTSSTISPDDHVYAPVDSLTVDIAGHTATATIRGRFSTRCAEFEDVQVIDSGKTIEVLPIMTAGTARSCERADMAFERKVELPRKQNGRYLVHVRSLNGQALNHVFEIN